MIRRRRIVAGRLRLPAALPGALGVEARAARAARARSSVSESLAAWATWKMALATGGAQGGRAGLPCLAGGELEGGPRFAVGAIATSRAGRRERMLAQVCAMRVAGGSAGGRRNRLLLPLPKPNVPRLPGLAPGAVSVRIKSRILHGTE
jgi:hypothetical protein